MFRRTLLLLALISLLPVSVLAQEEGGSLAVDYWVTVNLNEALQWEEGLKQHLAWRREQADTWTWQTWQIVRGEELGRCLISSGGHT